MDNVNEAYLRKQIEVYTRLLKQHEANSKERELKSLTVQRITQNSRSKPTSSSYRMVKMPTCPVESLNKKYSFNKSHNLDHTKRTVIYNQNQDFKLKHISKNQTPDSASQINKNFKSVITTNNSVSVHKRSVVSPNKSLCVSTNEFKKTSSTKDFIKEIENLTELLKKKTSRSQPNQLNSTAKSEGSTQDKLLHRNYKCNAFNYSKSVKNKYAFSQCKNPTKQSPNVISGNITSSIVNRKPNTYTKINASQKSSYHHQLKTFNANKFCYKKVNVKQVLNSKATTTPLKIVKSMNEPKENIQKTTSLSHAKKIFSDSKIISDNLFTSSNSSAVASKVLSPSKQELMKMKTDSISVSNKVVVKSPTITKGNTPNLFKSNSFRIVKSAKEIKLKQHNVMYTKINKRSITPNKAIQLKYSVHHKNPSLKKTKENINENVPSYKNKNVSCLISPESRGNSSVVIDSDSFLNDFNDSVIDKMEKNLLAISTALTGTPVTGKHVVNSGKICHSPNKINSKLQPMRKAKTRISKYKIINSRESQEYSLKKRKNLTNVRTSIKRIRNSKFSLINKRIQPLHLTSIKKEKPVLVKRLFKSKNAIVNKNATPTSCSAKMIKSKYLTFKKRKSPNWQKQHSYSRISSYHSKFKGYSAMTSSHYKQSRFQRTAISVYHQRLPRKLKGYGCQTFNRHFYQNSSTKKNKRKISSRYNHSPVVFIRGMRYSLNSSGKTLKKLPIKGQTTKTFKRAGGVLIRTPETSFKTLTPVSANLASRVLYRSINRILTASSKKNVTKVNTYCMFYNRFGRCNRGVKCTYIHDPSKIAVCTRFLRGTCKTDGCPFSHEISPGKMAICSYFLAGVCEKENCSYRHEKLSPNAVLCKSFVQGYCPNGKECKKAHVLICPKYIQGECDKGSSCAFPHPPQKAKKNVEKEMENGEKKTSDVFLEKVFRYFEQCGDCTSDVEGKSENNTANLFVPKRRKLDEQPSFIPLSDSPAASHNN